MKFFLLSFLSVSAGAVWAMNTVVTPNGLGTEVVGNGTVVGNLIERVQHMYSNSEISSASTIIKTLSSGRNTIQAGAHDDSFMTLENDTMIHPLAQNLFVCMLLFVTFLVLKNHRKDPKRLVGHPSILAIGLANPKKRISIDDLSDFADNLPDYDNGARMFFKRVNETSGIESRYFSGNFLSQEGIFAKTGNPSVAARNGVWEAEAKDMAIRATNDVLKTWGGNKDKISHVVFHSCTGFKAPGIELDIIDACNLTGVKRRLGINFMGCFGGFTGMTVAKSFVEADPSALVLLVCVEVCSAHFNTSTDRSRALGNSIFADGGAAVIIGAGMEGDWAISDGSTTTLGKETRDYMTWSPSDGPYDMFLSKDIGKALGVGLVPKVFGVLMQMGMARASDIEWCIHPGGRKLLDIFSKNGLGRENLHHSYETLRNYGNMSSPTIFFVIQHMLDEQKKQPHETRKNQAVCIGFGPGLTIEIATLRRIETAAPAPSLLKKQNFALQW